MGVDIVNLEQFYNNHVSHTPYDLQQNTYGFKLQQGSDISAHLPFLKFIAGRCNHITEFGTRDCYSTSAFLMGCVGKVVSYDININPTIKQLQTLVNHRWQFIQQDTTDINLQIDSTDFLFIDSLHTKKQVELELIQAARVSKYIGFHDTYSQGEKSLDKPGTEGINKAINNFLTQHSEWSIVYCVPFNHGLTIIEKNKYE